MRVALRWQPLALCLALCCFVYAQAQLSAELEAQLQRAEDAQQQRQPSVVKAESSIIPQSPKADLPNGDGDISTLGRQLLLYWKHSLPQPVLRASTCRRMRGGH